MAAHARIGHVGPQPEPQRRSQSGNLREAASTSPGAAASGRRAVIATADRALAHRLSRALEAMRWVVEVAAGGAEAMVLLERVPAESSTLLLDSWLPDLEVRELARELSRLHAGLDVFSIDSTDLGCSSPRGAFRNEVLHALRTAASADDDEGEPAAARTDAAAWAAAPDEDRMRLRGRTFHSLPASDAASLSSPGPLLPAQPSFTPLSSPVSDEAAAFSPVARPASIPVPLNHAPAQAVAPLPEFIGTGAPMLEVSRRIRLVAPRRTPVLVQGETGTGKELVARALHRLSPRAAGPFIAVNCAAIPEALLESELFGHARGAFTGAVHGRPGRIEAAAGGTLFLDEIGELPLAQQAKLLRFVESGELQRVGENHPVHVDVRIVAATHRRLGAMAREGSFRADLFYRLSVFLIRTPSLREHREDLPLLVSHFLGRVAGPGSPKRLTEAALGALLAHDWPGNIRELEHVLERASILAEARPEIDLEEIDFGLAED